jgi:hypothetical protein
MRLRERLKKEEKEFRERERELGVFTLLSFALLSFQSSQTP